MANIHDISHWSGHVRFTCCIKYCRIPESDSAAQEWICLQQQDPSYGKRCQVGSLRPVTEKSSSRKDTCALQLSHTCLGGQCPSGLSLLVCVRYTDFQEADLTIFYLDAAMASSGCWETWGELKISINYSCFEVSRQAVLISQHIIMNRSNF